MQSLLTGKWNCQGLKCIKNFEHQVHMAKHLCNSDRER